MLLLSKEDIKKVFSMKDAVEADKTAFRLHVEGKCDAPLRTSISAPKAEGTFLFMPAYAEEMEAAAVKIVNVFGKNPEKGLPGTVGQVLLIDGNTGMVVSVMDGTYVTQVRTGAASGAAFDLLGKKDCRVGALIGTGSQAASQLEAMLAVRELKEVRVCARNFEHTKVFADEMNRELAFYGTKIVAVETSDEAVTDADLIITATTATSPVFDASRVKAGATVSCVGGYQPHMQELDPAIFARTSKIYFDSQDAVLSEAGDILIPLEKGLVTKDDFTGDLGYVVKGELPARENDEEIIVFKSVGIATQDLVAAKQIYDKAKKAGVGMEWG